MVNAAQLATLAIENTGVQYIQTNLVKAARTAVHLYAESRYGSAVKDIGSSNKKADIGTDG